MVDSTILIDYFRKTDKNNSRLISHFKNYDRLFISSVTEFEVINGSTPIHLEFWDQMLLRFTSWILIAKLQERRQKLLTFLK